MKRIHRFNQVVSQTLGRSEKTDVLTGDLPNVDQRVAAMVKALEHTKKKLVESLRSTKAGSAKDEIGKEKRRKALEEHKLSQAIINDAKAVESVFEGSLLSEVMTLSGDALGEIVNEIVQYELQVEEHVLERLTKFHDDLRNISNHKEKLKKLVLDMDSARTRLNAAQSRGERTTELQDELDSAELKVESNKDSLAVDLYTLASKEVDMAVLFKMLLQIQIDFHRSALKRLEAAEPRVVQKIDEYTRRPVYGCPLEDHLRYSGNEIALVLEVCCSALCELGMKDEGLFRISGNATKIRRLKSAFDAGEIDLGDYDRDPHSIAGALKSYLRELPDSLMTNNLYRDWMNAVKISNPESRLTAIKDVIKKLPKSNYANLRYLIKFLAKLAENQHVTKMNSQNLAIVMAPNMIWSTTDAEGFGVSNMHGTLVEILISNANFFFPGEIKFTSPHISAIIDKTGGFLENGPLSMAATLTVNVAKALADDGVDGQLSPNKSSARRPKQPAPPPPPILPKSNQMQSSITSTNDIDSSRLVHADESLSSCEDDGEFDFSPEVTEDVKKRPLPPRPPEPTTPRSALIPPQPQTTSGFIVGHRKTNSLDRPLRPPPRAPGESVLNTSMDHQKNGQLPKEEELDSLLLAGFGESDGQKQIDTKHNTLPRPQQPQRPPLPSKMMTSAMCGRRNSKIDARRVSQSDESEDDEPVVSSLDTEHIYYDVPSLKKQYSPPSVFARNHDSPVALLSITKTHDQIQRKTPTSPLVKSDIDHSDTSTRNDGTSVAQRRESLMKIFNDQQAGQNSIGGVPLRPKPPVPSKPKSGEFSDTTKL